ncbi:MAG: hypothetical protein H7Z41_01785 [Cytophagales bacterium]|nr:hypothetical protein [Armatimonadota bacterium]
MPDLPGGTIALLFTDIEDFTRHCSENEAGALASLRRHDALVRRWCKALQMADTGHSYLVLF